MNNSETRQSNDGVAKRGHLGRCLEKMGKTTLLVIKSKDDTSKVEVKVIKVRDKESLPVSFNVDNLINQAR